MAGTTAGQSEVLLNSSLIQYSAGDEDINLLLVGVGYGYFLTDSSQIGGTIMGTMVSNGSTTTLMAYDAFYKYHFNTEGTSVPYIGVQGGMITFESGESADTIFSYGGMAGIKFFARENVSYFLELNYRRYQLSDGGDATVDQKALLFGLSYYF